MKSKKRLILSIALAIAIFSAGGLTGYIFANMATNYRVANVATIKTVGVNVFWEQNCTNAVTQINWGMLEPNESKTFMVYVRSASNVPLTVSIYAENWNPVNASQYIFFAANPNNFALQPNQIAQTSLTLNVASNITGVTTFAFDIVFSGSE